MKKLLQLIANKINGTSTQYKVQIQFRGGKCYILTPFHPGKGPWCYGSGIKDGDTGTCTITILDEESPYTKSFEVEV